MILSKQRRGTNKKPENCRLVVKTIDKTIEQDIHICQQPTTSQIHRLETHQHLRPKNIDVRLKHFSVSRPGAKIANGRGGRLFIFIFYSFFVYSFGLQNSETPRATKISEDTILWCIFAHYNCHTINKPMSIVVASVKIQSNGTQRLQI